MVWTSRTSGAAAGRLFRISWPTVLDRRPRLRPGAWPEHLRRLRAGRRSDCAAASAPGAAGTGGQPERPGVGPAAARVGRGPDLEQLTRLRNAVELLPMRERQAIRLRYAHGMSMTAIAQALEVSDGTRTAFCSMPVAICVIYWRGRQARWRGLRPVLRCDRVETCQSSHGRARPAPGGACGGPYVQHVST
jgi:hypothetical protein